MLIFGKNPHKASRKREPHLWLNCLHNGGNRKTELCIQASFICIKVLSTIKPSWSLWGWMEFGNDRCSGTGQCVVLVATIADNAAKIEPSVIEVESQWCQFPVQMKVILGLYSALDGAVLGKLSYKKNGKKRWHCPLWATPPPKRVKRGHLLSDYRQKCVNATRDMLM